MLIKTIKHEFLATFRRFGILYIGVILLAILSTIVLRSRSDFAGGIVALLAVGIIVCVVFLYYNIVATYEKMLFSTQGYLEFTLPVSTTDLLLSKIIVNVFWAICSFAIFFACGYLFLYTILSTEIFTQVYTEIGSAFNIAMANIGFSTFRLAIEFLVSIILFNVSIAFCCAIVHTKYIKSAKKVVAVVVYLVLTFFIDLLRTGIPTVFKISDIATTQYFQLPFNLLIIVALFGITYYFLRYELEIE